MNFSNQFLKSLHSNTSLTPTVSIEQFIPMEVITSESCKNCLPYIQALDHLHVNYPYHYSLSDLNSYCLIQTESGEGTLTINEETYILSSGTIAFVDCQIKHDIKISHSPWNYNVIFANGVSVDFLYLFITRDNICVHNYPIYSKIPKIIDELFSTEKCGTIEEITRSKFLLDLLTEISSEKSDLATSEKSIPDYMAKMRYYLDTFYSESFTLDYFEQELHISKYRLCREFSFHFKSSPIQYLNKVRILSAKKLLLTTDKRINEIGQMIGIENTNHFIQLFKKETGVTPLYFRKQPPAL